MRPAALPGLRNCDASDASIAARQVTRTYDQRNRVTTLAFPDGRGNQSWTYTPDGLPASITTNNSNGGTQVVNAYTYNKRRLLTGEALGQPGFTWSMGYGYNAQGNTAVSLTQPGGEVVSFAPNALGQATQATSEYGNYATGVSYYPNGAIAQFTYGNGIVHTLTQNTRQLPDRSQDAYGGTAVLDDSYDFDQNGNVAAISDALPGNRGNRTMTYDGLDRLKTTTSPMFGAGANYEYDVLDNLTRVTTGGSAARDHYYCYDGSWRLTNVKTGSCSGASVIGLGYDEQGNLANKNGQIYAFDYGNRLRYASGQESYRYDGHGRRVSTFSPSPEQIEIRSIYGHDGVLRYQHDFRKGKVFNYIYLAGSLVATRETPMGTLDHTLKYQHTDALGSPVAVTDANRNVVERSEYEPYGKLLNRPIDDGPGYTGHVEDALTGLTYMQQRYYDPQIGRFLSVDPVTADGNTGDNFNRYKYASNNPYRFTDPDGRKEKPLDPTVDKPRAEHPGTETPIALPDSSVNPDAYNCHSDAWHDGQGDPGDADSFIPEAPRWDNSPVNDVANARDQGGQLSPDAPNRPGDVIVCGTDANGNGRLDPSELAADDVHSARVIGVDSDGNTTRVQSKEGGGPITDHHPSDQNPVYGQFKEWYRP